MLGTTILTHWQKMNGILWWWRPLKKKKKTELVKGKKLAWSWLKGLGLHLEQVDRCAHLVARDFFLLGICLLPSLSGLPPTPSFWWPERLLDTAWGCHILHPHGHTLHFHWLPLLLLSLGQRRWWSPVCHILHCLLPPPALHVCDHCRYSGGVHTYPPPRAGPASSRYPPPQYQHDPAGCSARHRWYSNHAQWVCNGRTPPWVAGDMLHSVLGVCNHVLRGMPSCDGCYQRHSSSVKLIGIA